MIIADDHFNGCETLQELCDKLNTIAMLCWERGESLGDVELPSLPVFSDDVPEEDCLSWDDVSVLKIDNDEAEFYIDDRQDCVEDETPKKMFYSQYFYH